MLMNTKPHEKFLGTEDFLFPFRDLSMGDLHDVIPAKGKVWSFISEFMHLDTVEQLSL